MTKSLSFILILATLLYSSCNDDDSPVVEIDQEVITDLIYTLIPVGGGTSVSLTFRDPDGDGGMAPSQTVSDSLVANTTYDATVQLINASDPSDPEDINVEIRERELEHQFFYTPSTGLNITPAYVDRDAGGNPIGLVTTLKTGAASSGTFKILLRHEPTKGLQGTTITDPGSAGGTTDIEVTFDVTVK